MDIPWQVICSVGSKSDKSFRWYCGCSPSIWFPGFLEYLKGQKIQSDCIYLSLGDKEEKTRNSAMAQVGNCIRQAYAWLNEEGIRCTLEWNTGGHFKDTDLRTAKCFCLGNGKFEEIIFTLPPLKPLCKTILTTKTPFCKSCLIGIRSAMWQDVPERRNATMEIGKKLKAARMKSGIMEAWQCIKLY